MCLHSPLTEHPTVGQQPGDPLQAAACAKTPSPSPSPSPRTLHPPPSKRRTDLSWLPFYLPYVVPLTTYVTHYARNAWLTLLPAAFVWLVVPLLDHVLRHRATVGATPARTRLTTQEKRRLGDGVGFRVAIYLWAPTQLGLLYWALCRATRVRLPIVRFVGLLLSLSLTAAEGINCAHELLHRRSRVERGLGYVLLVSACYGHFAIEHARGHHVRVATRADPATLRYGESFYAFLPRTVVGGLRSAWRLETARLGGGRLARYSVRNAVVACMVVQTVAVGCVARGFGAVGAGVFAAQAAAAVTLLEQVNAIEHYGLVRRRGRDGRVERVAARHSWDGPSAVSGFLMFKLQLHAEHHLDASLRYPGLEVAGGSGRLPAGYLTLAPLLLVPAAWRAVMDPVLRRHWARWDAEDRAAAAEAGGREQA